MTETLHSMVGGNNVFRHLGFPEDEAQALLLRGDRATQTRKIIGQFGIRKVGAAKRSDTTQLRWNHLVKSRIQKFTLDTLMDIGLRLGCVVKPSPKKIA